MRIIIATAILFLGTASGQSFDEDKAMSEKIRYESFSRNNLESAESAVQEYRWRANYEIKQRWNDVEKRLSAKGERIPEFADWLFSFGTIWKTIKESSKDLVGKSEDEKKAYFIANKYEELVISNNDIKELIIDFNDGAEEAIERNLNGLANALSKNDDWGYEVVYPDKLKGAEDNTTPIIEINWEDLRTDIIQSNAIDLVGIDLSLIVGGFLTTVAIDAIYAYIWASNLSFIGTIAANLGIISAPSVFGVAAGPVGIGIGITLSVAGGWIYMNYAEDDVAEKLQHDFSNISTNLEIGDWVYQSENDYRWLPGVKPVIELTNATSFNQYIENVNSWNPDNIPLTPFPIKSTKRESIKSLVDKSNINHHEGFYTFNIFDEAHQDEFKEATEYFPYIDYSEIVFYYLEEHWFTNDKSLIVSEDKLFIDWGGRNDQIEIRLSDLFLSEIKQEENKIKINDITIFEGTKTATKELTSLLQKISRIRGE